MATAKQVSKEQRAGLRRLKATLPPVVATLAVRFFRLNFRKQGFVDKTLDPWTRRRDDKPHAILVETSRLLNSIRKSKVSFKRIVIAVKGPAREYAGFHNVGTDTLPQRQFMGGSRQLDEQVMDAIEKQIDKTVFARFT